ncbi:MAG: hypothetical protein ACI9U2_001504 [Bradymonadia bacterium]|jgi:hypothetical protein
MAAWGACASLMACGGGVIQSPGDLPTPPPGSAFVQIICEPADAEVYIDGKYHGRLDGYPRGVMRVLAGQRRVMLTKAGHYPQYAVVEASAQAIWLSTHLVASIDAPVTTRLAE